MITWVGGSCSGCDSITRDDGLPVDYTNWMTMPVDQENCAVMKSDKKWHGSSCTETAAFVCKEGKSRNFNNSIIE